MSPDETVRQYKGRVGPLQLTDDIRAELEERYERCEIRLSVIDDLEAKMVPMVLAGKDRYLHVGEPLGVPWWWIAAIHHRESNFNFRTHLHNGDPLSDRTVHVPVGRPKNGTPPFTWEVSADDALRYDGVDRWMEWTVAGALWAAEIYNGLGYRRRGLPSPYLWSGTDQYVEGKFGQDHRFFPKLVDQQFGVATIFKFLDKRGLIEDWY